MEYFDTCAVTLRSAWAVVIRQWRVHFPHTRFRLATDPKVEFDCAWLYKSPEYRQRFGPPSEVGSLTRVRDIHGVLTFREGRRLT